MSNENFPIKPVMVDFPIGSAKITLTVRIDAFKQRFQHYREAVEQGRKKVVIEFKSEELKKIANCLCSVSLALLPIFGEELHNKVFEAADRYYVEEMDVAILDEVIAEIEERFPDSNCYKFVRRDEP